MLSVLGARARLCDGITRREALRIGGLAFTGLAWPDLLRARAAGAAPGRARACIVIFNYGGPSHIDTWDLKPDAPREVRGEFRPIASSVPGTSVSEHLPRLAAMADRFAIIRSVTHRDNDHAIGAYLALTGHSHPKHDILGIEPPASPQDLPSVGSVIGKRMGATRPIFPYVTLGDLRHFGNHDSMGQNAGCLGKTYDAFTVPFVRPLNGTLDVDGTRALIGHVPPALLAGRRRLSEELAEAAPALRAAADARTFDRATRRAYELLASPRTRDAFDLEKEPRPVLDAYGPNPFARNCLLARRLVEAGVPFVTVYSVGNRDWDTHKNNFNDLKQTLLPALDRGLSALLADLDARGLLDETLVIWMGDMGRTPRVNREAGRDHWSFCGSAVIAGAGVRGGSVLGASDRFAAYPSASPVAPADLAATIFHSLGIPHHDYETDQTGRPFPICSGTPVYELLG
jgi:hypothetical protein